MDVCRSFLIIELIETLNYVIRCKKKKWENLFDREIVNNQEIVLLNNGEIYFDFDDLDVK